MTYRYDDGDDMRLTIDRNRFGGVTIDGDHVSVPVGEFPAIIDALYREAEEQPPVLLDRPVLKQDRWDGGTAMRAVRNGRHVEIFANGAGVGMSPGEARAYAAAIAELADRAEREPTDEEVAELKAAMIAGAENGTTEEFARILLRKFSLVPRDE